MRRVLFVAEDLSRAQVVRSVVLARSLEESAARGLSVAVGGFFARGKDAPVWNPPVLRQSSPNKVGADGA